MSATALHVEIADRFASGRHARLVRAYGRWILQDENSRNGTFVDGAEIERCELRDGAVIEVGRSYFVYREAASPTAPTPGGLETANPQLANALLALARVAEAAHPVMLRGETGSGKEVLARAVHRLSKRSGTFQAINCAALAPSVAEAELFGYRKGAFSGALEDRPGLIRSAHNGTLFLDEIGDLPLPMQGLLLRALQELEVTPVGATRPVQVDFRLVSATHRDLEQMAATGLFRPDLLARIEGFTLRIPPLRERREDLGTLVAALLRRHAEAQAPEIRFSLAAARALFRHSFPLNVRELEKALAVALTLCESGRIDVRHFPRALAQATNGADEPTKVLPDDPGRRREELVALLREHHGNVAAVARALGRARMQIHRWMQRYELKADDFR